MRMPFEKHRGVDLEDLPEAYLDWVLDRRDFREAPRSPLEHERRARQDAVERCALRAPLRENNSLCHTKA